MIGRGIYLGEFKITNLNLSHETNRLLAEVGRAGLRLQAANSDAAVEAVKILEPGKAKAVVAGVEVKEIGKGLGAQARSLKVEGSDVLNAQIARTLAENAQTHVTEGGLPGLITMAKRLTSALNGGNNP